MATQRAKPSSVSKGQILEFERERETRGAVRFKELMDDDAQSYKVGSLYMRKEFDKELGSPEAVKVTIQAL